jgi:hypothetical protein
MNPATIIALLQLTAVLLTGAQNNTRLSTASLSGIVNVGNQAVQLAAQGIAMQDPNFQPARNTSMWPNVAELVSAAYRDGNGKWTKAGPSISPIQTDTSFGDLNKDGFDDASIIVKKTTGKGTVTSLAILLNQGGTMFNIADVDLGSTATIYSHSIASGTVMLDMQTDSGPRVIYYYALIGEEIVREK